MRKALEIISYIMTWNMVQLFFKMNFCVHYILLYTQHFNDLMESVGQQYTIQLLIACIERQREVIAPVNNTSVLFSFNKIVAHWRNLLESQDPVSLAKQNMYL